MKISQIDSVTEYSSDGAISFALDEPRSGQAADTYHLTVAGWVLGRDSPMASVEIYSGRLKLIETSVSGARPDIGQLHSAVAWAPKCGFRTAISLLGFPGRLNLRVVAVAGDGKRSILGTITGRRASLPQSPHSVSAPLPLLVTTLGRSGSTWFLHLLGSHPQVVSYRPFERDPRVATYWLGVLLALGQPSSYLLPVTSPQLSDPRWWLGDWYVPPPESADPALQTWLGRENIQEVADFCRHRITSLYAQFAQERREALYVAEKASPNIVPFLVHDLFPDGPDIVLVRDFRDMFCSIIAYTERRGTKSFGRDAATSDEEYAQFLRGAAEALLETWKKRPDSALLVRYEDLVTNPYTTLKNVLTHSKLDSSDETIAQMVGDTSSSPPGARSHRTVDDPARSIGRWRRDLSPSMQTACEDAFGDVLREFGYD
jgi:hypothetical protein